MTIAITGAGRLGGALGRVWARAGHEIIFGVRDPGSAKVRDLVESIGGNVRAASVAEAASVADVLTLAIPWSARQEVIEAAGDLRGKIVIDCNNPPMLGMTVSGAAQLAHWADGATVVKAFNTTGAETILDTDYGTETPDMFICCDDDDAKERVARLAEDSGFVPVDAGPLANAPLLESIAVLWRHLAFRQGMGRHITFKVLRTRPTGPATRPASLR